MRHIHFRISKEYYYKIIKFCNTNNITVADLFRILILKYINEDSPEKILLKDTKFKRELIWEIRRYGNNLNQIAHKLNIALKTEELSYSDKLDIQTSIEDITTIKSRLADLHKLLNERL